MHDLIESPSLSKQAKVHTHTKMSMLKQICTYVYIRIRISSNSVKLISWMVHLSIILSV